MNDENLKPIGSASEAREKGRKGGIASGEARRRKKAFRDYLNDKLDEGDGVTRKEAVVNRALNILIDTSTSTKDFLRAFELIRDTIGEKPVERVVMSESDPEAIDIVEAMKREHDGEGNRIKED